VLGKLHYFGPLDKPDEALERWLADEHDLRAGRVPRSRKVSDSPTLGDLVNQFLKTKGDLRDNGERSPHTFNGYADVCDELLEMFGADRLLTDLLPRISRSSAPSGRTNGELPAWAPRSTGLASCSTTPTRTG